MKVKTSMEASQVVGMEVPTSGCLAPCRSIIRHIVGKYYPYWKIFPLFEYRFTGFAILYTGSPTGR